MLDKLYVTTNTQVTSEQLDSFSQTFNFKRRELKDRHYECCSHFTDHDRYISIAIKRFPVYGQADYTKIELNPSKIGSITKLNAVLSFFDKNLNYTIRRIDLCCDINIPLEEFIKKFWIKHKRARHDFENKTNLTGMFLGSENERYVIYDIAYRPKGKGKFALTNDGKEKGLMTRIEARFYKGNVPIKDVKHLHKYLHFDVFNKLEVFDFLDVSHFPQKQRQKALDFFKDCENRGMITARKKRSSGGNFKRVYDKFLTRSYLEKEIYDSFYRGMIHFFDTNSHEGK